MLQSHESTYPLSIAVPEHEMEEEEEEENNYFEAIDVDRERYGRTFGLWR
jgi:hypothetical protein